MCFFLLPYSRTVGNEKKKKKNEYAKRNISQTRVMLIVQTADSMHFSIRYRCTRNLYFCISALIFYF